MRQGCPLSPLFIKELTRYEEASGAKINYDKTKGLWVGKWKPRRDEPLSIPWTNGNVKTLGVYFGNDDPARQTFTELLPKVITSTNFWKQFRLSKLAKARVVEIFHASRLWYAARFYPIPPTIGKDLQKAFLDYINYPHKTITISQDEMYKLREHDGAKLVNVQAKSEASKIQWLVQLCSNPILTGHLSLVTDLLGEQKGKLQGLELFFTSKHYARRVLRTTSPLYKR